MDKRFFEQFYSDKPEKTTSGFYSPTFANLDSLWFRETTDPKYAEGRDYLDQLWNSECDEILFSYVRKYGPYFSTFEKDIQEEIEANIKQIIDKQKVHFPYYIMTKVHENKEAQKIWKDRFEEESYKKVKCYLCGMVEHRNHQKSDVIRGQDFQFLYCSNCYYKKGRYRNFWTEEIEDRYIELSDLAKDQIRVRCDLCKKGFEHSPGIFRNIRQDLVYPNLFANICFGCYITERKKKIGKTENYKNLYNLFLFTGRIPIENFYHLQYLYKDKESLLQLYSILLNMKDPDENRKIDGKFKNTLVKAGILKETERKKIYEDISLSKDGHICFSDLELKIDNYLYENNIPHTKDPFLPQTRILTNWKLEFKEKTTYIELVENIENKDYHEMIQKKKELAQEMNLELVCIYPKDNWEKMIQNFIKN